LANFAPKIAKLVKFTLKNTFTKNFPDFFVAKKQKFTQENNTDVNHV
jgi:hypothetical protein